MMDSGAVASLDHALRLRDGMDVMQCTVSGEGLLSCIPRVDVCVALAGVDAEGDAVEALRRAM
ncbi:MAG: hypothetical protein P4L40_13675 [Terracidiphilus sp.]|nr:hypothetical protein [Terracidiphilus sp.]